MVAIIIIPAGLAIFVVLYMMYGKTDKQKKTI